LHSWSERRKEYGPIRNRARDRRIRTGYAGDNRSLARRAVLMVSAFVVLASVTGCELVPKKPEAVFVLYRERMRSGRIKEARALLSDRSRKLALELASNHNLQDVPENLAFFNVLDPVSPPLVMKESGNNALLQVRTLKGGLTLIPMVRKSEKSPWTIDIAEQLKAFRTSLRAGGALEDFRELAGDYAVLWKDFKEQLSKMRVPEPVPEPPANRGKKSKGPKKGNRAGK
jgi:hypothetical protein